MKLQPARQCRFCKCTADNPCRLRNGDECAFVTKLANRCNAPACVKAFEAERKREIAEDREQVRRQREAKRQIEKARRRRWRRAA